MIARHRSYLATADSIDELRICEANGAAIYWTAWQSIAVQFPKADLPRVPDHWREFGTRRSPISRTSRRAPNPANAILNYLYTLLESETRLAISALGLDPGFGLLHVDHGVRDSLVYDLMEPVRPKIDEYVFDWISGTPLKRSWFFEQADGTCRLMADLAYSFATRLQPGHRKSRPSRSGMQRRCLPLFRKTAFRLPARALPEESVMKGRAANLRRLSLRESSTAHVKSAGRLSRLEIDSAETVRKSNPVSVIQAAQAKGQASCSYSRSGSSEIRENERASGRHTELAAVGYSRLANRRPFHDAYLFCS